MSTDISVGMDSDMRVEMGRPVGYKSHYMLHISEENLNYLCDKGIDDRVISGKVSRGKKISIRRNADGEYLTIQTGRHARTSPLRIPTLSDDMEEASRDLGEYLRTKRGTLEIFSAGINVGYVTMMVEPKKV